VSITSVRTNEQAEENLFLWKVCNHQVLKFSSLARKHQNPNAGCYIVDRHRHGPFSYDIMLLPLAIRIEQIGFPFAKKINIIFKFAINFFPNSTNLKQFF
jgi:hypothetical protein